MKQKKLVIILWLGLGILCIEDLLLAMFDRVKDFNFLAVLLVPLFLVSTGTILVSNLYVIERIKTSGKQ